MDYLNMYELWLANPYFDEQTKKELEGIKDNEEEIKERFYADLEFGTGGLRGIIGAGTNRMNIYTVRKATQGLVNYIKKTTDGGKGVAIAYDSRRMSPEFAEEAALCICANGIKAYVFESLRPTPELSFAVRELSCIAGINITASHNPPEYNGYKVYWEDGSQITHPNDTAIMDEVKAVTDYASLKTMPKQDAVEQGLYVVIGQEIDDRYMAELKKLVIRQDCIDAVGKELRIVYTPLHGTGNLPARRILSELGFAQVSVVPEQELPDGNFPTVDYPNPEDAKAFALALQLAKEQDADLVLATDPDADRLGIYVKDTATAEYVAFTGNMAGCLLAEYELSQWKEAKGGLPADGALIKTIVSSNMADAVAKHYNVKLIEVLTGFKYIGQQILAFETNKKGTYLFGFEESYGCLIGTHARDKDAVAAVMAICEAAAYYKAQGKTLWDAMTALYEKYGYYKEDTKSITLKGIEGLEKINQIMERLRQNPPAEIGGRPVLSVRDYKKGTVKDMGTGELSSTELPSSNVLYYDMGDDFWICVRPSGTEPKIKFYIGAVGASLEDAEQQFNVLGNSMVDRINGML